MTIKQRKGGNDFHFCGPGTISTINGFIKLKMFPVPDKSYAVDLSERFSINLFADTVAGQVFPDHYYYDLDAVDLSGDKWRAEKFRPHIDTSFVTDGMLITGSMWRLTGRDRSPGCVNGKSFDVYFRNNSDDFPCNVMTKHEKVVGDHRRSHSMAWDVAQFKAANLEFEVRREENGLLVSAYSKDGCAPENLPTRISEAMSFVFGEEFTPAAVTVGAEEGGIIDLYSGRHDRRGATRPPYQCGFHDPANSFWRMFASYLEYIILHPGENWHPITSHVLAVHRSGGGSIDAQALSLALAVEGIAKLGYESLGAPTKEEKLRIGKAISTIADSSIDEGLKARIIGAVGNMKSPRAEDRLIAAAKRGLIRSELIKTWKKLRNTRAHAAALDTDNIQRTFDECNAVRTLLNELVFSLIGYQGYFSDYSLPGWPIREYAQAVALPSGAE